jgi:hypothetical protein
MKHPVPHKHSNHAPLNTISLTSLYLFRMFTVSKYDKRHMTTRSVNAGFPCLNVNYTFSSDVSFSRTIKIASKKSCRTSNAILFRKEFYREGIGSSLSGWDKYLCGILFLNPSKPTKPCKPTLCAPHLRRRIPAPTCPRGTPPPLHERLFTSFTRICTRSTATKPRFYALARYWMRTAVPALLMNCVLPSTTFLFEVQP